MQELADQMEDYLANYNPYERAMRVLDTDYDNYLIIYNCEESDAQHLKAQELSFYLGDGTPPIIQLIELNHD